MKTDNSLFSPAFLLPCLLSLLACPLPARAQSNGGDQFLDGIGETALVARYLFNGNAADRSRNGYQATLHGAGGAYVEDRRFGTVLSLPGTGGAFVQIPGESLLDMDAITVTGWVFLRSDQPWQRFFDFGPNTTSNFFCTPVGEGDAEGYRARLTTNGWTGEQGPTAPRVPTNRWVHLAVVLDAPRHSLNLFLDGARVGQSTNLTLNLEQLLDRDDARHNQLYLGKSHYDTDPYLNAKLRDVRLYGIALTDQQVATICKNAGSGGETEASAKPVLAQNPPDETRGTAWSAFDLLRVPDISVETMVGTLPRLPRTVAGEYRDGAQGPEVRIIWPSPTGNQSVLQPGTFIVTGRIAGTKLEPKAFVTVSAHCLITR